MSGAPLLVQSGAYLDSSAGVEIDTKWTGAKTFFGSDAEGSKGEICGFDRLS